MKKIILILVLSLGFNAFADDPPAAKNWKESKAALTALAAKFRDSKLTKEQKVELLPLSNTLLYDTQQLKLSAKEKSEQIKVIVDFLGATESTDFANSNTDSVYDDYKANKKAYTTELSKLDKKTKDALLEGFDAWATAEKDMLKKDKSESEEGSSTQEMEH